MLATTRHDGAGRSFVIGWSAAVCLLAALGSLVWPVRPVRAMDEAGRACVPSITAPLDQAVIPADMAALTVRWQAPDCASSSRSGVRWVVEMRAVRPSGSADHPAQVAGDGGVLRAEVDALEWRPSATGWAGLREGAGTALVRVVVRRAGTGPDEAPWPAAEVRFTFSSDPVDAAIFYREVPLPLRTALARLHEIRWRLGRVSSRDAPQTVLTHLPTCANCHSFSADGSVLAMDVDYGDDKGSFAVTEVEPETVIEVDRLISWNWDRDRGDRHSLGLLSRISPDGRWVASTVKETTVHRGLPDLARPQLFFPVRGLIAIHDRGHGTFFTLPGAEDPDLVQTNPVWSPDQQWIVFARAEALPLDMLDPGPPRTVPGALVEEMVAGRRPFRFDLYRVPFAGGRGGTPEPLPGASHNGRSNYFPVVSPDGRWIVFCQASSFMLNQPDAALLIMPADGGEPRRMTCSFEGRMSSWHSFSPNGRWMVFSAKADGPYTQLWLTHVDEQGRDTVPVRLDGFVGPQRAANIPEMVHLEPGDLQTIRISGELH